MDIDTRLKALKELVAEQDKYNYKALKQNEESLILNEQILKQQEPVTKKLDEIIVKQPEKNENNKPKALEDVINENSFSPFFIEETLSNKLSKSIKPTFFKEIQLNKEFQAFKINNQNFYLFKDHNNKYVHSQSTGKKYILTEDLEKLLRGQAIPGETQQTEINKYLEIIKLSNGSMKSKYIKSFNEPIVQEGDGLKNINSENLIDNFITLNKLIAAKKAGHNNVDKDIKNILNKLNKKGLLHKTKYQKILKNLS
jgi:hypothetical protein